jgi:site-specific recombinase XerD
VLAYYDRYLDERLACPAADASDFVLVNLFHAPLGQPMTASAVRQSFARLGRNTGLARPVHPHMARHMAGTELVEAGVAIDVVQALLGHRRLASTQIYAHASDRRVREAVEAVEALSRRRRGQHPEEAR